MRKNIMLKLLALMFALLLPLGAFAGTIDEFRLEELKNGKEVTLDISLQSSPGLMMNGDGQDWLSDLTKAISLKVKQNDTAGLFNVLINGETVLNIITNIKENGDVYALVKELDTVFNLGKVRGINKVKKSVIDEQNPKSLFKIDLKELTQVEKTGDAKLDEAIANIIKNTVIEDYKGKNDKFDKAVKVITQKISNEDFVNILQSETCQKSMKSSAGERNAEQIEKFMKSLMYGATTIEMTGKYHIDADGYVVAFEAPLTINVDNSKMPKQESDDKESEANKDEKPHNVEFLLSYYRKTDAAKVNNEFAIDVKADKADALSGNAYLNSLENGKYESKLSLKLIGETVVTIDVEGEYNIGDNKNDGKYVASVNKDSDFAQNFFVELESELKDKKVITNIAFYVKNSDFNLEKSENDMQLATLKLVENYMEKEAIPEVDTKDAIDIENITQADESRISKAVQEIIPVIVQKLPQSVIDMFMPSQDEEGTNETTKEGTEETSEKDTSNN